MEEKGRLQLAATFIQADVPCWYKCEIRTRSQVVRLSGQTGKVCPYADLKIAEMGR